jgi:hypothetical protein
MDALRRAVEAGQAVLQAHPDPEGDEALLASIPAPAKRCSRRRVGLETEDAP